jgi:L-fuconolactonase
MLIDTHVHVWGPDADQDTVTARVEDLIEKMDEAGVERAVLVQPGQYGADHRYLAAAAAVAPDRFRTVALPDCASQQPGAMLDRLAAIMPLAGIRLRFPQVLESGMTRPADWHSLLTAIAERNLVVTTLGGQQYHPLIRQLAKNLPDIRFVIDHLGSPRPGQYLEEAFRASVRSFARLPNVSMKLSGFYSFSLAPSPHADCVPFLHDVLDQLGVERLMWGSDFPYHRASGTYAESVQMLSHHLPADVIKTMHDTAAKVWLKK